MKRVFRDSFNGILGGVCSGLGEYFEIDPVLLRIVWTVIAVFTGFIPGIIVYIIALFIVPQRS